MNENKYIIIEDESLSADMLAYSMKKLRPSYQLEHVFSTVRECNAFFDANPENNSLLFMDVTLPDGPCFEIFNHRPLRNPVIFITAHTEWAIKAFKVNSVDYLLKPLDEDELLLAIQKYESFKEHSSGDKSKPLNKFQEKFLINLKDRYEIVNSKDIALFEASGKYVSLYTFSGAARIIDYTLKELESILAPDVFCKISRSLIVNHAIIDKIEKLSKSRLQLRFHEPFDDRISIINNKRKEYFLDWYTGNKGTSPSPTTEMTPLR